jgi:dTDP-4-dehydrorhamnose 3,5-epimerase
MGDMTSLHPELAMASTPIEGVRVISAPRYEDDRGWFAELWNAERYRAAGLDVVFAQDNVSYSRRGVLRGMHFQWPHPQGKLVTVLRGAVLDVVVDIRTGSPTFGRWFSSELSDRNYRQLWVPEGCAHGFLVRSDDALVHYSSTRVYDAQADRALAWDDADVAIDWLESPLSISEKDRRAPSLRDLSAAGLLPSWNG